MGGHKNFENLVSLAKFDKLDAYVNMQLLILFGSFRVHQLIVLISQIL